MHDGVKKIKTCVSRRKILNLGDKYMFDPGGCTVISEMYPCWVLAMHYRCRQISQGLFFKRRIEMCAGGGGGGFIVILVINGGGGFVNDGFE